jgi:Bifunctional DNA primase/polymerase, N-terminal/AAA domain
MKLEQGVGHPECVPQEVYDLGMFCIPLPPDDKNPYSSKTSPTGWDRGFPNAEKNCVPIADLELSPDENYGIVLNPADGAHYVVVDFDDVDHERWKKRLPRTFRVRTPRGEHWYYRAPEGWTGKGWVHFPSRETKSGQIKSKGYMVGPGSVRDGFTYEIADSRDPVPAPEWVLERLERRESPPTVASVERSGIPHGSHDIELHALASWARDRWGLNQTAIADFLWSVIDGGLLEDQDPRNPYTPTHCDRIARSVSRYVPGSIDPPLGRLRLAGSQSDLEVPLIGPPTEWLIQDFIPQGLLTVMHGPGKIGKSTFHSHLAAIATQKGLRVMFFGIEESFRLFAARARLGGSVPGSLLTPPETPSSYVFPRDSAKLREIIRLQGISLVIFDSLYSHFSSSVQGHEGTRSRICLGPVAEAGEALGCTIFGTIHNVKDGSDFSGSGEVRNVARSFLEARRNTANGGPFTIFCRGINDEEPDHGLAFHGERVPVTIPGQGTQKKRLEDGSLVDKTLFVLRRKEKTSLKPTTVRLDSIAGPTASERWTTSRDAVRAIYLDDPYIEIAEVIERTGASKRTIIRVRNDMREEGAL